MKFAGCSRHALILGLLSASFAAPSFAQSAPPADDKTSDTVFVLGRIENGITSSDGTTVSAGSIDADTMRKFDLQSVDEAVNRIPGANASNTGGSRNERLIYVRGFDRFQTTLSIDGVRVFLPADNRIDFGRFLTADLAEVQVSKGYVSVLNGPGGLGGAVNLVTRKPSRALEAELVATATTDSDLDFNSSTISGLIGTKQDQFYVQLSGAYTDRDSWSLSKDFNPTVLEDGGKREHSESTDWSGNFKAGWTPNDTDEYAISYIKQSGDKNAPYHITDTASTRFWDWPYWNIDSVYFLSRTAIGDRLTLKTRVYYDKFKNLLQSFDSAAQTTQTLPRSFKSYYDDTAKGANVSLEAKLTDTNTLTGAATYREDQHNERQYGFTRTPATGNPSVNAPYIEPWQPTKEDTYSIALEDVQKFGANLDLVLGASYDWTDLKQATDANVLVTGTTIANSVISFQPVTYPLRDMNATNYQAALVWRPAAGATVHASVSSRTRFPTLFERFSSRFGTAIPNPNVDPERSTNYEIGGKWDWRSGISASGAIFYSDVTDALIQQAINVGAPFGVVNQTKNAGDGSYSGFEAEVLGDLFPTLHAGANVTYTHRDLRDPTNAAFRPAGVPDWKWFAWADWDVTSSFIVTPSVEIASPRWTVTSSSLISPPQYYRTGNYALLNLTADWRINAHVSLLAAAKNITDKNYVLVDGFPEEGRNFTVSLKLRN